MKITLLVLLLINIFITIGLLNEGDIIPKQTNKLGKIFYIILLGLLGGEIMLCIIIGFACKPIIIKYKAGKRRKKIAKRNAIRRAQETPPNNHPWLS